MTLEPGDRDDDVIDVRICAVCGHAEADHELIEADGASRVVCRECDDAHPFEPVPDV
jgi:hypothetical protein